MRYKVSIKEYSKQFSISEQTIYKHIKAGKLEVERIGHRTWILLDDKPVNEPIVKDTKVANSDTNSIEKYKLKELKRTNKQLLKDLEAKSKLVHKLELKVEKLQDQLLHTEQEKTEFIIKHQDTSNKHFEKMVNLFNSALGSYRGDNTLIGQTVEAEIIEDKPKKKKKKKS